MNNEINLPGLHIMFHVKPEKVPKFSSFIEATFHVKPTQSFLPLFLIAGGRAPSLSWLKQAAYGLKLFCADKGVEAALAAELTPYLLIGDCDSTSQESYQAAEKLGTKIELHPTAKDDTDLQLLLEYLSACRLIVSGIWGGRFDHLLTNVYSLLSFKEKHYTQVIMADEKETMILLTKDEDVEVRFLEPQKVQAVSLLPLRDAKVSISGVRWSLQDAELLCSRPYAISNELQGDTLKCACSEGAIGLYICWYEEPSASYTPPQATTGTSSNGSNA